MTPQTNPKNYWEATSAIENCKKVGLGIVNNSLSDLSGLQVRYVRTDRKTYSIVWNYDNADKFPIFQLLTKGLISRLEEKKKQLSTHQKNLVFVGVNHLGPINWMTPNDLFENGRYDENIQNFLSVNLPPNVIGVCYYYYSIDREGPFFPLKIFWREENNKIPINLG